jgi:hypothetical protein
MEQLIKQTSMADIADKAQAALAMNAPSNETTTLEGEYHVTCSAPLEKDKAKYLKLRAKFTTIENKFNIAVKYGKYLPLVLEAYLARLDKQAKETYDEIQNLLVLKWSEPIHNLITTVGKNDLLDKYLAGSAYTATWYVGLISSTSYSAIVAADTMASHAGWLEAGAANTPTYSNSTRIVAAWSAASAGVKALSAALGFLITGTGTVKGCFLNSISTKDGTTGTLFSAGLFTGGDKAVANTDTLNVTYQVTAT